MKKYYYCYKITLTQQKHELYNHYYLGARISKKRPEEDYYHGSSTAINRSGYWDLYPLDYTKEIIKTFGNPEDLYNYEHQLIGTKYKDDPLCLNIFIGGCGGRQKWNKTDEELLEINQKIGIKNKGNQHILKHPEITHERLSKAMKGRQFSLEWRQNISKARIGKPHKSKHPEITSEKIRKLHTGRKHSDEHRQKIREATIKYYEDPNNRLKMSESVKAAMNTPEIKEKCSLGGKLSGIKLWINKDGVNKRCLPEELNNYINTGWIRGRYDYKRIRN